MGDRTLGRARIARAASMEALAMLTASGWWGRGIVVGLVAFAAVLGGCRRPIDQAPPPPDYSRPIEGNLGIRRLDPSQWPDLTPVAQQMDDEDFRRALDRSLRYLSHPGSRQFFPTGDAISHDHARYSVYAFKAIGEEAASPEEALARLHEEFDVWESVGWDGSGEVLFTGYFSPVFTASRTPDETYRYPLYRRPPDLKSDPNTGAVIGSYPSRRELEASGKLRGLELVYLPSRLDAYIIEVNGSAKLNMTDGSVMYVGYAGHNGHEYVSIRKLMVEDGVIDENTGGLSAMRAYFREHPEALQGYIDRNPRFIFFREYEAGGWPAGSLGYKVTPMRSLATDKAIFPRASVVFVKTTIPTAGGGERPFDQLMLDQDTGGAIRAAGRADIYIGIGDEAEALAGRQAASGRLYYLLLKPERVAAWYQHAQQNAAPGNSGMN